MRNGVGWARRLATGIAISLVAVMAMGGTAGAATSLKSYSATASGTTFNVSVQLPAALGAVLNNVLGAGNSSKIEERISFSNATSNVVEGKAPLGSAFGQVFKGTLDNLLLQVAKTPLIGYTGAKLPEASAALGQKTAQSMKAIELLDGAIDIKIAEATAESKKYATNPSLVNSKSESRLLGIKVGLPKTLDLENLLKPLTDVLEGDTSNPNDGLLGTINGALKGIGDTLSVPLALPSVSPFLKGDLVKVGVIESVSETGATGASRWANAVTKLAGVELLGGYVTVDVITTRAHAVIDGTAAGARNTVASVDLATVKLGKTTLLNLNTRELTVAGKTIEIPLDLNDQLKGLIDILGVKVSLAPKPTIIRNATHARAAASSLHIEVAPKLAGGEALLSVALDGPAAVADVRGSNVLGITTVAHPRTGVSDQLFLLVGPALLGLAIVTRRFVLAK
jgi:hypothetical protein